MTTAIAGGKITGLLALTCATDVALAVGDFVHVIGDYKVALADGTKSPLGSVSVRSVKRVTSPTSMQFPVPTTTGGQVTVEARGLYVKKHLAGAAITAGADVGINSSSALVTVATGVAKVGVALMGATASGQYIDVLVTGA